MWDFGPERRLQMAKGIFDQLLEPTLWGLRRSVTCAQPASSDSSACGDVSAPRIGTRSAP